MRARLFGAMLLGSLALVACSHHTTPPSTTDPVPVHVGIAADRALDSYLDLAGSISAIDSVNVGAISAGRIVAMNVRVGDRVTAGQVLAQVDAAGYRARLAQAESRTQAAAAQATAAAAQVQTARAQLQLAEATARRMSVLYREGAISRQEYDQTQADLEAAYAGLRQAASGYAAARAAAAAARAAVGAARAGAGAASVPVYDAVVRAPFPGIV